MLEDDPVRLIARIEAAEEAILVRTCNLANYPGGRAKEREALIRALNLLSLLRQATKTAIA